MLGLYRTGKLHLAAGVSSAVYIMTVRLGQVTMAMLWSYVELCYDSLGKVRFQWPACKCILGVLVSRVRL